MFGFKFKSFKKEYELEGLESWWNDRPDLLARGLSAKYQKNALVSFSRNKNNIQSVNVSVDNMIVGFVNFPRSLKILQAIVLDRQLHGKIVDVTPSNSGTYPPSRVVIAVSSFKQGYKVNRKDVGPKSRYKQEAKAPLIDSTFVDEVACVSRVPHRILDQEFSLQPSKDKPAQWHRGKIGIYCLWTDTHETYIGQSTNIGMRMRQHVDDLDAGKHHNKRLQRDWKARGHSRFRFDVVKEVSNHDLLDELEAYYICEYNTYSHGYNATPDGQGIAGISGVRVASVSVENSVEPSSVSEKNAAVGQQPLERGEFSEVFSVENISPSTNRFGIRRKSATRVGVICIHCSSKYWLELGKGQSNVACIYCHKKNCLDCNW